MNTNDSTLSIDKFQTFTGERVLAYEGDGEILRQLEDTAAVMVRLDLDGNMDRVILDGGPSNDLRALTRARDALTEVIDRLAPLHAAHGAPWVGRCMAQGDWGRCHAEDGREGPCKLPTEADWQRNELPVAEVPA